jgi:hypothetical protein
MYQHATHLLHGLDAHRADRLLLVPHHVAGHQGELLQEAEHELHSTSHDPVGEAVPGLQAGVQGADNAGRAGHGAVAQPQQAAHRHQLLAEPLLGRAPHASDVRVEVELPNNTVE